jgi:O-antigen/teichoic acid export membrane protein
LAGVVLIYTLAPWKVKWGISKESAKELVKFGIPFQLNSILAFLKDRLVILIVANMVGPLGIGYTTWAQNITFLPLEVMNIMTRLTFPAFSRLQHDQVALKETLERTIFFISLLSYPILFGVLAVVPSIVEHIYKYDYRPALPMIYMYSLTAFWAAMSTPFTNFLNAIGKIKITLKLMIMWTILEWVLTPILTYKYGFIGVALASAIISFTSLVPIYIIKRMTHVSIIKNTYQPFLAALTMGIITYVFCVFYVRDLLTLALSVVLGGFIYVLLIGIFAREMVLVNFKKIKNA